MDELSFPLCSARVIVSRLLARYMTLVSHVLLVLLSLVHP